MLGPIPGNRPGWGGGGMLPGRLNPPLDYVQGGCCIIFPVAVLRVASIMPDRTPAYVVKFWYEVCREGSIVGGLRVAEVLGFDTDT